MSRNQKKSILASQNLCLTLKHSVYKMTNESKKKPMKNIIRTVIRSELQQNRRKKNLIVYGIPDTPGYDTVSGIEECFKSIDFGDVKVLKVERIGREETKDRPVRFHLEKTYIVKDLLRNAHRLKKKKFIQQYILLS